MTVRSTRRVAAAAATLAALALAGCAGTTTATSPSPSDPTTSVTSVSPSASPSASASASPSGTPSASASASPSESASASATPGVLAEAKAGNLELTGGFAYATMQMGSSVSASASAMPLMTAAYATVRNTGSADDALVAVHSPVAGMAELHETVMVNGAGKMQKVEALDVPAGATLALKPGGNHIMLMELTGPLTAGSKVPVTFTFRSGATMTVDMPVIARQDRPGQ